MPHYLTIAKSYLENELKDQLSKPRLSIQLCLLALLASLPASIIIILFRLLLDFTNDFTKLSAGFESDYASLLRVLLPVFGAIVIWLLALMGSKQCRRVGIAYVLHRVKLHYGKIPLQSAPLQFFQSIVALASHFTIGKEGTAVHLGAVSASVIAEKFNLPANSIRIMCASGIAAGIAAIFNSPLAAVIFVFEVILREYRSHYFFPIMISATCGTLLNQLAFGNTHEFELLSLPSSIDISQYPLLALSGVIIGCIAAFFNYSLIKLSTAGQNWPLIVRLLLAGIITSIVAFLVPETTSSNNDLFFLLTNHDLGLTLLAILLVAKLIAAIAAVGFGIPGGMIGPLYLIGGITGAIMISLATHLFPSFLPYNSLYIVIGMTVLMGVSLSAPLAGLVALLELTNDTTIIFPAMLVSIPAYFVSHQFFKIKPLFLEQLKVMGLDYRVSSISWELQKIGVRAVMDRNIKLVDEVDNIPTIICPDCIYLFPADNDCCFKIDYQHQPDQTTHISKVPIAGMGDTATLDDVYALFNETQAGYVYVHCEQKIIGVITAKALQQEINKRH